MTAHLPGGTAERTHTGTIHVTIDNGGELFLTTYDLAALMLLATDADTARRRIEHVQRRGHRFIDEAVYGDDLPF